MKGDHTMNTNLYLEFITNTVSTEGWKVADNANKLALASKRITQAQYSEAARLIAKAFLEA